MKKSSASCLLAAILFSCASQPFDPSVRIQRSPLDEDLPALSLPSGSGGDLARKQPVLYLQVEVIDQTSDPQMQFTPGALAAAKTELEVLLPRMKRFTVYSVFNDGAKRLVRELGEIGEMEGGSSSRLPPPDVLLNVKLTLNCEKAKMSGRREGDYTLDEIRRYQESVFYSITNPSGKTIDDSSFASDTIVASLDRGVGRIVNLGTRKVEFAAGFDPDDESSQAAIVRLMTRALNVVLAGRLAKALPLTAEVVAINPTATAFSLSKGSRHGVYRGGEVVVWASSGDFDYVIADAIAEPTTDRSMLKVVRWNTDDPDAAKIVEALRNQPDAVKRYKLFGTTRTIPKSELSIEK